MTQYSYDDEKTQAVGRENYPVETPTEVVPPSKGNAGRVYPGDRTIIRPKQEGEPSFAWFVITKGQRMGDILRLNKGDTTLGREPDNDVSIDDEFCSRRHAKIKLEPASDDEEDELAFYIYDLATPNGTLVNGEEILRAKLTDGDKVQIGETVMVFKKL